MKIISKRIFRGKNIYSHKKCIRVDVNLEGYAEIPSKDIPNFNDRLLEYIPELKEHRCGIDVEGGFVIRLKEGTYLSHICEHMIIALQNKLGIDIAYGKAREYEGEHYYIVFQYIYERTAIEIAELAVDIINSLIKQESIDIENRIVIIKNILAKESIGPSTLAIKNAAERRGLPVFEIENSGYYQIGYGKQRRLIEATISNKTSCISTDIACDKLLTKKLLQTQNIPVADGDKVYNVIDLIRCAESIGYPVVLKPQFGNKGNGVILNIKDEKELILAYEKVLKGSKDIIIEKYLEGNDYRVCVVNNEVIAVSKRIPPYIIGDGKRTILELINEINEDPKRGEDHEKPLTKIKIDDELNNELSNQNYSLQSVLENKRRIYLRKNANISTGGLAIDYTDKICEENIEICKRAAKTIGLDICGIDITTKDIGVPINSENDGVIIEINAAPGIRMHHYPSEGVSRDVGDAIVNYLYDGKPSNIPVISITGTNGKTTTTRMISHVLKLMGYTVGMTSTDGIFIDDKCIDLGDDTGYESAKSILLNNEVDVAVLETARGGIIKKGIAYDLADVGVLTNITEDHLGIDDINSMEELSFVKALVCEAIKETGYAVINADDEWSKKIIPRIKSKIIYFSKNKDNKLLRNNIENGGIGVFIEKDVLCVINNHKKYNVIKINDIPITLGGKAKFNLENSLAVCSALVGIGVDYCMIAKGLMTFQLDDKCNSGRFNIYEVCGRKIILDYGHNIEGYTAIFETLERMNKRSCIGVVGVPGDRSNDSIKKIGELCKNNLDKIIIKEDKDLRGRESGEVANLIKEGIGSEEIGIICLDEVEALKKAYCESEEGDVIIVFYEKIEPLKELIKSFNYELKAEDSVNS